MRHFCLIDVIPETHPFPPRRQFDVFREKVDSRVPLIMLCQPCH